MAAEESLLLIRPTTSVPGTNTRQMEPTSVSPVAAEAPIHPSSLLSLLGPTTVPETNTRPKVTSPAFPR